MDAALRRAAARDVASGTHEACCRDEHNWWWRGCLYGVAGGCVSDGVWDVLGILGLGHHCRWPRELWVSVTIAGGRGNPGSRSPLRVAEGALKF